MTSIAFICTGNSCRSQMAEGFARAMAKPEVEVHSAGVAPIGVNPRTIAVMKEIGLDLSKHYSKNLEALPQPVDFVVTVCNSANQLCPQLLGKIERIHWDIPDPKLQGSEEEIQEDFRRIRELIRSQVETFLRGRRLLKI